MNKDEFGKKWHEIRGRVKTHWSRLTDNELEQVKGSSETLIGILESGEAHEKFVLESQ